MKLDSTVSKVYYSRDGRIAARVDNTDPLQWCVSTGQGFAWHSEGYEINGDWLPAEPPKFPELPPKPLQVLAYFAMSASPKWFTQLGDCWVTKTGIKWYPSELNVVPHPDNDPEAIKLIEDAKRG